MITATLKTPKGETVCEIPLPSNPSELPLANYVSFLAEAAKVPLPGKNVPMAMAKAVSEFSGVPFDTVLTAQFGEDWNAETTVIDGVKTLYGWCVNVLGKWKGELRGEDDFEFTHKGEAFTVPYVTAQALSGAILPDIEVVEAIEAFEVVRLFTSQIETGASVRECVAMLQVLSDEKERETYTKRLRALVPELQSTDFEAIDYEGLEEVSAKHGDESGNMAYTRYLRMMAILCRKPGEKLPADESQKKRFIAERSAFFQDIDTATALDADFFLLTIFNNSGKINHVVGSLIHPVFGHVVETKSQSVKRIREQLSTRRLSTKESVGAH